LTSAAWADQEKEDLSAGLLQSKNGPVSNRLNQSLSQPLAGMKSTFDFMKQFAVFATLAAACDGQLSLVGPPTEMR